MWLSVWTLFLTFFACSASSLAGNGRGLWADGKDKRQPFQPWGGKRSADRDGSTRHGLKRQAFQPWGGKRSIASDAIDSEGDDLIIPAGTASEAAAAGDDKRGFQPWGGKRAFPPWGGKRAFQPWGGKRAFQPWGGKRAFQPWGGKRAFQPWGGKRAFQPWGGKRDTVSELEKRAFQPWGGKRADKDISEITDNKRAFQPWGGKRAFQPWGGKRAFQPWGGKRAFQPWGGKRAFQPWGGKRATAQNSNEDNFSSDFQVKDISDSNPSYSVDSTITKPLEQLLKTQLLQTPGLRASSAAE